MSEIKKFVIKEIRDVLREEKHKHQIKKLSSILFEAVDIANMLKDNPKKYYIDLRNDFYRDEIYLDRISKIKNGTLADYDSNDKIVRGIKNACGL